MHESAVCKSIIDTVVDALADNSLNLRVGRLFVRTGILRAIDERLLTAAFEAMKTDYHALSQAELVCETIPLNLECKVCGYVWKTAKVDLICPVCNSVETTVRDGNKLEIEKVEVYEDV